MHSNPRSLFVREKVSAIKKEEKQESRLSEMLEVLKRNDIAHGVTPEKLRTILEELGPTFIKFGQILSMRPDLIPQTYCQELSHLRSEVTPLPFSQVQKVIQREYGVKSIRRSSSPLTMSPSAPPPLPRSTGPLCAAESRLW